MSNCLQKVKIMTLIEIPKMLLSITSEMVENQNTFKIEVGNSYSWLRAMKKLRNKDLTVSST